jgi:N-acyl-L-homoserine lactone synthetase
MRLYTQKMSDMSSKLVHRLSRYRYDIFITKMGWKMATPVGCELDEFDRPDTIFVVAEDQDQNIVGCARLLPTTRPYMLKELFPKLLNGAEAPQCNDVWELSRFAAVDLRRCPNRSRVAESVSAKELLEASIRTAVSLGAKKLITVSPRGMDRLIKRNGYHVRLNAPPKRIGGVYLCSYQLDVA